MSSNIIELIDNLIHLFFRRKANTGDETNKTKPL